MKRTIPFTAAGWEVLRFFLLIMVMTVQLNRELRGEMSLFLLWLSVVSLIAAAALFFAGISPGKYSVFVNLVAVIKVLQLFFGVVLVLYIQGVIPTVLAVIKNEVGSMQGISMLGSSLPAITGIVAMDFLSALFLGLYILRDSREGVRQKGSGDEHGRSRDEAVGGKAGGRKAGEGYESGGKGDGDREGGGKAGSGGEELPRTEVISVGEEE